MGYAEEPKQKHSVTSCPVQSSFYSRLNRLGVVQLNRHECAETSHRMDGRMGFQCGLPSGTMSFKLDPIQGFHGVQRSHSPRAGHGMPTKGCDVSQRRRVSELAKPLHRSCKCSYGHTAAKGFSHAQDIGNNPEMLKSPGSPGSSHAALDFIQDQHCARFAAFFAQGLEPCPIRNPNPGVTLHRFDHHARDVMIHSSEVMKVIPLQEFHLGEKRSERRFSRFVGGNRQSAMGVPVVPPLHRQDSSTPCHAFGQFQRRVDGFSSRIEKVDAVQFRREGGAQKCTGLGLALLKKFAIHHGVKVPIQLTLELVLNDGVFVPKI